MNQPVIVIGGVTISVGGFAAWLGKIHLVILAPNIF
jgi:hypothetical protein